MPTYTLEDKETGEQHEVFMSWDELQEYKKGNPHLKQVIGAPNIVSSSGGRASKVENHPFKEVLQKVGEAFPGSAVAKQHTRRTAKEVKTKEIVDKHRKLQAKGKKNV
tara:strand:- start:130 stop:453 length:324 start_codon:yes stop_codon:yes gene_type:complete